MAETSQDIDKKPIEPSKYIILKIKGQHQNEMQFKIKRTTPLKKLMDSYCERQSENVNAVVFLFDGRRIRGEQTANDLEMEDGDEIDAMLHQTGGSLINYA